MEKKIIEILLKHSSELNMKSGIIAEPEIEDWLWSGEFEKVAHEIVKLFAIPDVSCSLRDYCTCTEEPMWLVGGKCVTCEKPRKQ